MQVHDIDLERLLNFSIDIKGQVVLTGNAGLGFYLNAFDFRAATGCLFSFVACSMQRFQLCAISAHVQVKFTAQA